MTTARAAPHHTSRHIVPRRIRPPRRTSPHLTPPHPSPHRALLYSASPHLTAPRRATSWPYPLPAPSCRTTIRERDWLSRTTRAPHFLSIDAFFSPFPRTARFMSYYQHSNRRRAGSHWTDGTIYHVIDILILFTPTVIDADQHRWLTRPRQNNDRYRHGFDICI